MNENLRFVLINIWSFYYYYLTGCDKCDKINFVNITLPSFGVR